MKLPAYFPTKADMLWNWMAGNKQITDNSTKTEVTQYQCYIDKPLKGIYQEVPTQPIKKQHVSSV